MMPSPQHYITSSMEKKRVSVLECHLLYQTRMASQLYLAILGILCYFQICLLTSL